MNLNQIYSGNDYAYYPYTMSRGQRFSTGSRRVRAIKCYKKRLPGNIKESGYVEVLLVDSDGNVESNTPREVKATLIRSTWEEHADEMERRRIERERRNREHEERRQVVKRASEERARVALEEKERLYSLLDSLGIPRSKVFLYGAAVRIDKSLFLEMLNGLQRSGFKERNGQSTIGQLDTDRTL